MFGPGALLMNFEIQFINYGHLIKASLSSQPACRNTAFEIELKYILVTQKLIEMVLLDKLVPVVWW